MKKNLEPTNENKNSEPMNKMKVGILGGIDDYSSNDYIIPLIWERPVNDEWGSW